MDVNTLHFKEFVKENRNSDTGSVTSLTIKISAYAKPAEVSYTGDGNYLNNNDETIKRKTIVGREYYDYDLCTPLASNSFTYTIPTNDQTAITQDLNIPAANQAEQVEYRNKRSTWFTSYQGTEAWQDCYEELFTTVTNL